MKELLGLAGEPALVVGGGYGSGRLTAALLAEAGATVAVADLDGERARNVAAEIGGHAIQADVTTEAGATAAVDEAHDVLGGLTRVANIVGLVDQRPFLDGDVDLWERQLRLNFWSQLLVCHAAGRRMVSEDGGAIAMVASVSGLYGARNQVAYGAGLLLFLLLDLSSYMTGQTLVVDGGTIVHFPHGTAADALETPAS